jgi:cytochrome c556
VSAIVNQQVEERVFLRALYESDYYPDQVLDKGKAILRELCARIEVEKPTDLTALYALTQVATEQFNDLEAEFEAAGSEIETVAREEIAEDFWFVAAAYGFADADVEELIAAREW